MEGFGRIVLRLLQSRNFILPLAVVLSLAVGQTAVWTKPALLPVLMLIMTVSTASITSKELAAFKTMARPILISQLLNYFVLGGVILLAAWLMVDDKELWSGFVVLAAMPPAIAVTPYSYLLKGNTFFSLIGMVAAYLFALVITPAVMILFLGVGFLNPMELLLILLQIIIVPLIASRLLRLTKLIHSIDRWRGTFINWCFFVVVFTIIGLNRQVLFGEVDALLKISAVVIISTFVLGHVLQLVAKALHLSKQTVISWMLMGTLKNYGLASVIALTLFSEKASIPSAIGVVFSVLYVVWLGFYLRERVKSG